MLQEGLAAAVGGQQRGWVQAGEGAHGEDQPALARHHTRRHQLRDAQRRERVDRDDFFDLGGRRVREGHGDRVRGAHVVD